MHNTQQMVSAPIAANSIMAASAHQGVSSLTLAQQQEISQKLATGQAGHQQPQMSASQSYQQPNGPQQVFFKKRASSNTNPPANHAQSIVQNSPPKAVDKGPGPTAENEQQNEQNAQPADQKSNEGGKVASPKASAGATSGL